MMGRLYLLASALAAVRGEDCLARRSEVVADCDWDAYERENPDVKAAWGDDDYRHEWYRRHYMLHGRGEGRRCARRRRLSAVAKRCVVRRGARRRRRATARPRRRRRAFTSTPSAASSGP